MELLPTRDSEAGYGPVRNKTPLWLISKIYKIGKILVITASKIEKETIKKQKTAKDATTPRDNASTAQTTQDVIMSMNRAIAQTIEGPDATTSRVSAITAQTSQGATMSIARATAETTEGPDATTSRVSAITAQTSKGANMFRARATTETTEGLGAAVAISTDGQGKHYLKRL